MVLLVVVTCDVGHGALLVDITVATIACDEMKVAMLLLLLLFVVVVAVTAGSFTYCQS